MKPDHCLMCLNWEMTTDSNSQRFFFSIYWFNESGQGKLENVFEIYFLVFRTLEKAIILVKSF